MNEIENTIQAAAAAVRRATYDVEPMIVRRWSPRAMSGEAISERELMALFEAARWAPSSYNAQPWRFLYARRATKAWGRFFDLMDEFNRSWTNRAAVLIVVVSRKFFEWDGSPARTHSFDAGAAWQNLALQGSAMGLVVHGMQGFDYEKAKRDLGVPDDFDVEAMIAVGRPGRIEELSDKQRASERPSDRKQITEIAFEGGF